MIDALARPTATLRSKLLRRIPAPQVSAGIDTKKLTCHLLHSGEFCPARIRVKGVREQNQGDELMVRQASLAELVE